MGTRSRVILKRTTKPDIHLWMQFDGYWEGQGGTLCEQLRLLLEKYSQEEICTLLEALDVQQDIDWFQRFQGDHLMAFLEGTVHYDDDPCDDIEYEYVIDAAKGVITGQHVCDDGPVFVIPFASLEQHIRFEHIVTDEDEDEDV